MYYYFVILTRFCRILVEILGEVESGMARKKEEIITFKVDEHLSQALEGVGNRSAFIREAILSALGNACPVCNGTGILTVAQQSHWSEFLNHHHIERCHSCEEFHIICDLEDHKKERPDEEK